MMIVDSLTASAMETADPSESSDDDSTEIKKSDMLNKEEDEFSIDGQVESNDDDGEDKAPEVKESEIPSVSDPQSALQVVDSMADAINDSDTAVQAASAAADELPITPDGDMTIEFNLNS